MYLNMNSKQNFQEANSKFDLRKNENIWQPKDQVLENKIQHVPGMGYGYVLGINDLRELKDGKKVEEYEDIYQQSNYENILLKNTRNQSVRKTQVQDAGFDGMLSNTPGGERNREGLYSL